MSDNLRTYLAAEVEHTFCHGQSHTIIRVHREGQIPDEILAELEQLGVDTRISALSDSADALVFSPAECELLGLRVESDAEGYERCLSSAYGHSQPRRVWAD